MSMRPDHQFKAAPAGYRGRHGMALVMALAPPFADPLGRILKPDPLNDCLRTGLIATLTSTGAYFFFRLRKPTGARYR